MNSDIRPTTAAASANNSNINNSNTNNINSITVNMKTPTTSQQNSNSRSNNSFSSVTIDQQLSEQPSLATFSISPRDSKGSASVEFFNQQRISPENFAAFCEQLHSFVQCIKNVQDITNLTYNLPKLQEILDEEAKELDCLYGEVREATNNIERIKAQRKAIRKEKFATEKLLKKMKDEETREMETVISVYDRGMFARWEVIKNSRKLDAVENFLCDIEGKLLAMKHLKILATQKMNKVITWTLKETTEKKNHKDVKKAIDKESRSDKDGAVRKEATGLTDQDVKRRRTRQPRLSKTELPKIEAVNTTTNTNGSAATRTQIYSTALHTLDDNLTDRSHDSIRTVELNSEMQTVLRTLFGGPARRETSTPTAQIQTNTTATNASNTVTNPTADANDNREIHIYLSHSYQN